MCTEMCLHRSLPFPSECPVGWRVEGHFQWPSRTDEIEIRGHGKGLVRQIRTRSVSNVLGNPKNVQRKHLKSDGELSTLMHSSETKQRTHGGNHLPGGWTVDNQKWRKSHTQPEGDGHATSEGHQAAFPQK